MTPALLIRLRPLGPWRHGPGDGGRDRVDAMFRSDRLYSAVTHAMARLGRLDEWLGETARAPRTAVAFSSLFPFQGDTLFAPPPAPLWPPPANALRLSSPVFQSKIRWKAARFVPAAVIESLLLSQRLIAEQWFADVESGCLLRRDRPQSSPFRGVTRWSAAVDRAGAGVEPHSSACVEFEPGAGLWTVALFRDEEAAARWQQPVEAAFRLLADSGFGARRSAGWGQTAPPEFTDGAWPALLLPKFARASGLPMTGDGNGAPGEHWLLSLYSPSPADDVDWSNGHYSLTVRGGRVESPAGSGLEKKLARMVEEGSVLAAVASPSGAAVDVAPDGFPHPVYRAGFALSLRLPVVDFSALPEEPAPEVETVPPESEESAAPEPAAMESAPAEPDTEEPESANPDTADFDADVTPDQRSEQPATAELEREPREEEAVEEAPVEEVAAEESSTEEASAEEDSAQNETAQLAESPVGETAAETAESETPSPNAESESDDEL